MEKVMKFETVEELEEMAKALKVEFRKEQTRHTNKLRAINGKRNEIETKVKLLTKNYFYRVML